MKILIEKQSDKVIFAEDDLQFTSSGVSGENWECHLFNDSNAEIINVLAIPDVFVGNAFVFKDNAFVVVDNDLLQSEVTRIDGLKNIKPYIESPNTISMRQARLQLLAMNLLDSVNTAITSMSQSAQIEWEFATEVQRDNPLVLGVQSALSMTNADIDLFFVNANKL